MDIDKRPNSSEERGGEDAPSPHGQVHEAPVETERPSTHVTKVSTSALEDVARVASPSWLEQNERIRKLVIQATRPRILESTQRTNKFIESFVTPQSLASIQISPFTSTSNSLAGDALKDIGLSSALRGDLFKHQSLNLDAIARSTTERAGFSLTSGLKVSDSVTSMFSKLIVDTAGVGLASSVLSKMAARIEGPTVAKLGVDATTDLSKGLATRFSAQDLGIARAISTQKLADTSGIAHLINTDKLMSSWRQTLLAEPTARSLVGTVKLPEGNAGLLRDIVGINATTSRVVAQFATQNRSTMLSPALSARPTRALRRYLSGISVAPDVDDLAFATHASRGIAGITAADLLISTGRIDEDSSKLLEDEVVKPWLTSPQNARQELLKSLGEVDSQIPELLEAAWAQVELNGPAAVAMASHAAVEVLDRTLRALAPDDAVLAEHETGRLHKDSVYMKDGKPAPTRAGRVAYAVQRCHPGEIKLIVAQTKALAVSVSTLQNFFQAGKHQSEGTVGLVRMHLVSVEATLTQLLYRETDGSAARSGDSG